MAYDYTMNGSGGDTYNNPWGPQGDYLQKIFGGAWDAYQKQQKMGPYTGDYYAAPNKDQYGAYNDMINWSKQYGNIPGQQIGMGQGLMNTGFGAANGALSGLMNFANTDQTQNNINTANRYADNPYISGAADAAMAGAKRFTSESELPSLYRGAAGGDNINSSQAALSEGVLMRGLADKRAQTEAGMRSDAWNNGLNTALTQNQMKLGAYGTAGNMGLGMGGMGNDMLGQGIANKGALSNMRMMGANGLQDLEQGKLNNILAKRYGQINDMWDPISRAYGLIGDKSWGGSTHTSGWNINPQQRQNSPNWLSYLGAGLGAGGSLAGLGMGGGSTLGGSFFKKFFPGLFG